jgi:hypothetical protein
VTDARPRVCECLCVRACACACVCVFDCVWLEGGMGGIACVCIACVRAHSVRPLRVYSTSERLPVSAAEAERSVIGYTQCFCLAGAPYVPGPVLDLSTADSCSDDDSATLLSVDD